MENNAVWAIIPTRGGSQGLVDKNIKVCCGRPLLHYILGAALEANAITRVVLATDDDRIAAVASQIAGVETHRLSKEVCAEGQPSFAAFSSTLSALVESGGVKPRAVVLLRATCPLCLPSDIDNAVLKMLSSPHKDASVISVAKSDAHPQRMYVIDDRGLLAQRETTPEQNYPHPRQGFDDVYVRNGAVYCTTPGMVAEGRLWGQNTLPYIMPKERSININDKMDFFLAEQMLASRRKIC